MEENIDFSKIVFDGIDVGKYQINGDTFIINVTLSDFWGAKIQKMEGEVSEYCDEDGNEEYICIPIHRNNIKISRKNNTYVSLLAKRQIYSHSNGTHFLSPWLKKEDIQLREKLGIHKNMVGTLMPYSYKKIKNGNE